MRGSSEKAKKERLIWKDGEEQHICLAVVIRQICQEGMKDGGRMAGPKLRVASQSARLGPDQT